MKNDLEPPINTLEYSIWQTDRQLGPAKRARDDAYAAHSAAENVFFNAQFHYEYLQDHLRDLLYEQQVERKVEQDD